MSASSLHSPQLFQTPGLSRQALLEQRAHYMRFHPTPSEALLWSHLRGKRLGVQFRGQVIIGSAIVDFAALSARLAVEVDGDAYHAQRVSADAARDAKLQAQGWRVLRLPASLVERDVARAVDLARQAVAAR